MGGRGQDLVYLLLDHLHITVSPTDSIEAIGCDERRSERNKKDWVCWRKDAPCLWVTLAIQSDTNKGTSTLSLLSMQRYDETYQDTNPRIIQYIQTSLGYTDLYQRQVQSLLLGCSVFFVSFSYLSFSTQFSFHFQFLSSCPSFVRVSIKQHFLFVPH